MIVYKIDVLSRKKNLKLFWDYENKYLIYGV